MYQSIFVDNDSPNLTSNTRLKKITELYLEQIHKLCSTVEEELEGLNPVAMQGHIAIINSVANTADVMQGVLFDISGMRISYEDHVDITPSIQILVSEICDTLSTSKMSEFYYLIEDILRHHSDFLNDLLKDTPHKALIGDNIRKAQAVCSSGIYSEEFQDKYLREA